MDAEVRQPGQREQDELGAVHRERRDDHRAAAADGAADGGGEDGGAPSPRGWVRSP